MSKTILNLSHISKSYMDGTEERKILNDISIDVKEEEIIAIVGPSGSGKSTLLNIIGMMLSPDEGNVSIDGQDMSKKKKKDWTQVRRDKIGFIFQNHQLLPYLTAREQISMMQDKKSNVNIDTMMKELDVEHCKKRYPSKLSGGERQRVAIARAFVNDPVIILADEPTASLDEIRGRQAVEMIRNQVKRYKKAAIIVTHDARILDLVDAVYSLENGKVVKKSR